MALADTKTVMSGSGKALVMPNACCWYNGTSLQHLAVLQPSAIQVLVYENAWEQVICVQEARKVIPGLPFDLRMYADQIITFDPVLWVEECLGRARLFVDAGLLPRCVILNNEPNIEAPDHLKEAWNKHADWYIAAAQAWKADPLGATIPISLAAVSPTTPTWQIGVATYAVRGLGDLFDRCDSHCYVDSAQAYEVVLQEFPDKPVAITEFNGLDPAAYLGGLPERIVEGAFFILDSPDPQFAYCSLTRLPASYQSFKDYKEGPVTNQEAWQQLTAPYDTFPALTKAIVGRGGVTIGGEEVIGDYTFQAGIIPFTGTGGNPAPVVAYARTGDWGNVIIASGASDLPFS